MPSPAAAEKKVGVAATGPNGEPMPQPTLHDVARGAPAGGFVAALDPDRTAVNLPHPRDGLTPLAGCFVFNMTTQESFKQEGVDPNDCGAIAVARMLLAKGAVADFPCKEDGFRFDMNIVRDAALGTIDLVRERRGLPPRTDDKVTSDLPKEPAAARARARLEYEMRMMDHMMGKTLQELPQAINPFTLEAAMPPQALSRLRMENPEFDRLFYAVGLASRVPAVYHYPEPCVAPETDMFRDPASRCKPMRPLHILCAGDRSPLVSLSLPTPTEQPSAIAMSTPASQVTDATDGKATAGRFAGLVALLKEDGKVDFDRIGGSRPPLHHLVAWSREPAHVDALLAAGADPHSRDAAGLTALHVACERWDRRDAEPIVRALLRGIAAWDKAHKGAAVAGKAGSWEGTGVHAREQGGCGRTPLMCAVSGVGDADVGVIKALLLAGADPNATTMPAEVELAAVNDKGEPVFGRHRLVPRTPISIALHARQRYEVIEALLNGGADANGAAVPDDASPEDAQFPSPLVISLALDPAVSQLLLERGARVSCDRPGTAALMVAARNGYVDNHRETGAEMGAVNTPEAPDVDEDEVDAEAAGTGVGDDDDDDAEGRALDGCIEGGLRRRRAVRVLRYMIQKGGADVNEKDPAGFAAAHLAAGTGNRYTLMALIGLGADQEQRALPNDEGPTAMQMFAELEVQRKAAAAGGAAGVTIADSDDGGGHGHDHGSGGCCGGEEHSHGHGAAKAAPPKAEPKKLSSEEQANVLKALQGGADAAKAQGGLLSRVMHADNQMYLFVAGVVALAVALYLR